MFTEFTMCDWRFVQGIFPLSRYNHCSADCSHVDPFQLRSHPISMSIVHHIITLVSCDQLPLVQRLESTMYHPCQSIPIIYICFSWVTYPPAGPRKSVIHRTQSGPFFRNNRTICSNNQCFYYVNRGSLIVPTEGGGESRDDFRG
jgi:hypothetical protein